MDVVCEVYDESRRLCHPVCAPGLGGDVTCLFEDTNVCLGSPVCGVLSPSNTPASECSGVLARENLGSETPPSHQAGSMLDGSKPPSPCTVSNILGTKLMGGNRSPMEDLSVKQRTYKLV